MWLYIVSMAAITSVVCVLALPTLLFDEKRKVMSWLNYFLAWSLTRVAPGPALTVEGFERLVPGREGPYVVVANHQSMAEVIFMLGTVVGLKFIAKRTLFMVPVLFVPMHGAGHVQAGTGEEDDKGRVLKQCRKWIERGHHLVAFPEGTRSPDLEVHRFRTGAFLLAQQMGVKVLPVVVHETGKFLPKNSFFFRLRQPCLMRVLEPFEPTGTPKEAAQKAREILEAELRRIRAAESAASPLPEGQCQPQ